MDTLTFNDKPVVEFASNEFYNVPVILQYEDTPLIQVVRTMSAGFTTEIPIFHSDGTYLAKVVGSQLYATDDGKKAGVVLEHPPLMTVCKLGSRTLFELKRQDAARLKGVAELFTNDGNFIRSTDTDDAGATLYDASGNALRVGKVVMSRCRFESVGIGVLVRRNGAVAIGVGGAPPPSPVRSASSGRIQTGPKPGANASCPCGSGKKYKRCCGR